jgi:hypothetical protein
MNPEQGKALKQSEKTAKKNPPQTAGSEFIFRKISWPKKSQYPDHG